MKKHLKYFCAAALLLFCSRTSAQKVVSVYNGESEISAPSSVTLIDGFHTTGPVRIFTTGLSYVNCVPFVSAASSGQNYISTKIFKQPGMDPNNLSGRSICEVNETIQYFDGLGRPLQTVQVQGSPGFKDLVQPVAYDAFGREKFKYQPYAAQTGTTGNYRSGALADQLAFYNSPTIGVKATAYPFAETVFEASPLNRVLQQGAPGESWQISGGHTLKTEYGTNLENEVRLWIINGASNGASSGVYLPGKLYKTISKDENWKSTDLKAGTTDEFKDFEGRVVLKRVWESNTKSLSTYYVYDDLGNLRYVLPPAVNENGQAALSSFDETQAVFDQFIYGYHYDGRRRMTEKKLPGKGWEEVIYNPLDQVVFTQDAVQRGGAIRSFIKYDALGRTVMTGIEIGHHGTRAEVQGTVNTLVPYWETRDNTATNYHGYNNLSCPSFVPNLQPHVVNYYDDYNIPGIPDNQSSSYSNKTKGLLTASKTLVLGTVDIFLWTVNYYDEEGRIARSWQQHYKGGVVSASGYDQNTFTYNFSGELIASIRMHVANGAVTTMANRYEYDHMGRKIATFENINSQGEVALNHLEYNEIGQLTKKNLHNDAQATTFAYNERGWMKNSSSDQFSMELKYNDGSLPQFNGNISGQNYTNGTANAFTYSYDKLNRLTNAAAGNDLGETISYDVMGNITSLARGNLGMNNYTGYDGNKLTAISGFTNGTYSYDVNGNQKTNTARGITNIDYNDLNLPVFVAGPNVNYTYNAAGEKLQKQAGGTVTNYIDGNQYTNNSIDFIQTEEGLARRSGNNYSYEYNLSDHLGNVRVTFYKNPTTNQLEVLQRDNYYAFGLRKEPVAKAGLNKYLYNGKELQEEFGQYDYGARFYDPVIGRWNVVDPLAEKMRRHSSYNYGFNNPIRFVDSDGMAPDDIIIVGTKEYRQQVLNQLQLLTNQKLTLIKGGKVEMSGTPSGGPKPVGTDLVRSLIKSDHDVVIKDAKFEGNSTRFNDMDAATGKKDGGSGSVVSFDPKDPGKGVANADGTTGRPAQVGLGHELGHAKDGVEGKVTNEKSIVRDPDSGARVYMTNDELKVRKKIDNPIRREQGAKPRALPIVIP